MIVTFVDASRARARRRVLRLLATTLGAMLSVPALVALVWLVLVVRGVRRVEREIALVRVPAGCFMMGSPEGEPGRGPDEGPVHQVCVAAFELGKFELTQEQWQAVMLENPSMYVGERRPVENVSWRDAQRFIDRMNRFGTRRYRLPTEAEWEYAARAGSTTAYPWGPTLDPDGCKYANVNDLTFREAAPRDPISPQSASCRDGLYQSGPVGERLPNAFGLHDMQGNVWEWVADDYHSGYTGAPVDGAAWGASASTMHIVRGGSWHSVPRKVRSAQREPNAYDFRIGYTGFRLGASVTR